MELINIVINGGKAVTTSREVAKVFGKMHKNVLQSIENLQCSAEFNGLNFQPIYYLDKLGRSKIEYRMTRDGFTMLVMGFTGGKAMQFKEAYINAFNKMEEIIRSQNKVDIFPKFIRRYQLNSGNVPKTHFSVIGEMYLRLYNEFETAGYVLPDKNIDGTDMMPDISIGRGFSSYLKTQAPDLVKTKGKYKHDFGDGRIFEAAMYPVKVIPYFIKYVHEYWIPNKAHEYFKERDPKALEYLPKLIG